MVARATAPCGAVTGEQTGEVDGHELVAVHRENVTVLPERRSEADRTPAAEAFGLTGTYDLHAGSREIVLEVRLLQPHSRSRETPALRRRPICHARNGLPPTGSEPGRPAAASPSRSACSADDGLHQASVTSAARPMPSY